MGCRPQFSSQLVFWAERMAEKGGLGSQCISLGHNLPTSSPGMWTSGSNRLALRGLEQCPEAGEPSWQQPSALSRCDLTIALLIPHSFCNWQMGKATAPRASAGCWLLLCPQTHCPHCNKPHCLRRHPATSLPCLKPDLGVRWAHSPGCVTFSPVPFCTAARPRGSQLDQHMCLWALIHEALSTSDGFSFMMPGEHPTAEIKKCTMRFKRLSILKKKFF